MSVNSSFNWKPAIFILVLTFIVVDVCAAYFAYKNTLEKNKEDFTRSCKVHDKSTSSTGYTYTYLANPFEYKKPKLSQ